MGSPGGDCPGCPEGLTGWWHPWLPGSSPLHSDAPERERQFRVGVNYNYGRGKKSDVWKYCEIKPFRKVWNVG